MNVEQLLEEIRIYLDNCKSGGMLGSGSTIRVNREELTAMLDDVRAQLPGELAESKQILKTKESILADARARSDRILKDAATEAGVMIDDNEIVNMARMRADDIIEEAQAKADEMMASAEEAARTMQLGALQYTQSMMSGLEDMYKNMVDQEKQYFDAVLTKLRDDHRQVMENKREIDMQLGYGTKGARSREDFEKKEESKPAASPEK